MQDATVADGRIVVATNDGVVRFFQFDAPNRLELALAFPSPFCIEHICAIDGETIALGTRDGKIAVLQSVRSVGGEG